MKVETWEAKLKFAMDLLIAVQNMSKLMARLGSCNRIRQYKTVLHWKPGLPSIFLIRNTKCLILNVIENYIDNFEQ